MSENSETPDYFKMLEEGALPPGFDRWDLCDDEGRNIAVLAAQRGLLPRGFNAWKKIIAYCDHLGEGSVFATPIAFALAKYGYLPEWFEDWHLTAGPERKTVAHVAADCGALPDGFGQWNLRDAKGRTVAHAAAEKGFLPDGFDYWRMLDGEGDTVAHVAAAHNHLPKDFDSWLLKNKEGKTVVQAAMERGFLPGGFERRLIGERHDARDLDVIYQVSGKVLELVRILLDYNRAMRKNSNEEEHKND
jgi:hypothetical protein